MHSVALCLAPRCLLHIYLSDIWTMFHIAPSQIISGSDKKKMNQKIAPPLAGFMSLEHIFRGSSPLPGQIWCSRGSVYAPAALLQDSPPPAVRSLWAFSRLWGGQMPTPVVPGEPAASRLLPRSPQPNPGTGEDTNWKTAEFKWSHRKEINIS